MTKDDIPAGLEPMIRIRWPLSWRVRRGPVLVTAILLVAGGAVMVVMDSRRPAEHGVAPEPEPIPGQLSVVRPPIDRADLLDRIEVGVYQPTASGQVQSALYGSTRSYDSGRAKFHEGIDLAPMQRDRRGRPLDTIYAIADGRVAYVNRRAGASTYGRYVVLVHEDPLGPVYTLYAHLASVAEAPRAEATVSMGDEIGVMGNSTTLGLPVSRSHLHFEIGVVMNRHFNKLTPTVHGTYNGRNLYGADPLRFLEAKREDGDCSFADFLASEPPAFTLVLKAGRLPDYFVRYPALWTGAPHDGAAIAISVSEGGVPLQGRNASARDVEQLGRNNAVVLDVDTDVLGRNGRRLVIQSKKVWRLGKNGNNWLQLITYHGDALSG